MAATYESLATTTLGSPTATITFSSISSSYTDLIVIINSRSAGTQNGVSFRFNNDTGSSYSLTRLRGDGSAASSNRATNQTYLEIGDQNTSSDTAGYFGNIIVNIFNYSNSTIKKTTLSRVSVGAGVGKTVRHIAGAWFDSSVINEIDIFSSAGDNFLAGSTFTLYGIASA